MEYPLKDLPVRGGQDDGLADHGKDEMKEPFTKDKCLIVRIVIVVAAVGVI